MRRNRWRATATAFCVLAGAIVGWAVVAAYVDRSFVAPPPPASPPAPSQVGLSSVEAAYYRALAPLIGSAADEADALVALGERRERNLFTIRSAQGRMEQRLTAIDDFAAHHPTPVRFGAALATYRLGAAAAREAMAEARAGFLRFEWDRVAGATTRMTEGAAALRRAEHQLHPAAGVAPGGTPDPPSP